MMIGEDSSTVLIRNRCPSGEET